MRRTDAVISLHDVMPETLEQTDRLLTDWLAEVPPACLVLLVVPGLDWRPDQLDRLRRWQDRGIELAGHGWRHDAGSITTLYHCVHGRLVSGRAAEHLSKTESELIRLIDRNHEWFHRHDFRSPELYVPPAWALGRLDTAALQRLPFRYYESTAGLFDSRSGRFRALPLAGFEADRRWRVPALRVWNGLNRLVAAPQRPLRLAIHPHDPGLYLAGALARSLNRVRPVPYRSVFGPAGVPAPDAM